MLSEGKDYETMKFSSFEPFKRPGLILVKQETDTVFV